MRLALPAEDRALSPITGWTREHWAATADAMLLALRPHFSPGRARLLLPGRRSAYGEDSDALEGFARSFMLAAFRVRGENGADPLGILEWYRDGLVSGTDPSSGETWPRPDRLGQAKVEAASIALGLHLTRPWLWDRLDAAAQSHVVTWLSTVNGETYPQNNWVWFQAVVETFVASVGGPYRPADIEAALARHEDLVRAGGWSADGDGRSFDHYCGWALQFYPLLWAEMAGGSFGAPDLAPRWRARLSDYLDDAIHLIGADGAPLMQGRSLIYRFAVAAPLWTGAATGATTLAPGRIRRAASGLLRHFLDAGALDDDGLLTVGWHHAWPAMAQSYSGSGSPYWAAKGMFGLALPADHPVWTAVEQPLPVEVADVRRLIVAPGWLVSSTVADGVVRVVNHGTDHGEPGEGLTDSPLYTRIGYSTATVPPLTGAALTSPLDSSVAVLDPHGPAGYRSGFDLVSLDDDGVAVTGVSRSRAHWVDGVQPDQPDYGWGKAGTVRWGPVVTVGSLVRGPWEVRVARVEQADLAPAGSLLRFGGWPLASARTPPAGGRDATGAWAVDGRLISLLALAGSGEHLTAGCQWGVRREIGSSPLGEHVAVPWITTPLPAHEDDVRVVLVRLGAVAEPAARPLVEVESASVRVLWPDSARSNLWLGST